MSKIPHQTPQMYTKIETLREDVLHCETTF